MMEPALGGLRLRIAQHLPLVLVLAFAVSCSDSPVSSTGDIEGPLAAIVDGGHASPDTTFANPDVFFQQPLADFDATGENFEGTTNPNLMPIARICQLTVGDDSGTVLSPGQQRNDYTIYPCDPDVPVIANLPMTYNTTGGFYTANLRDAGELNPGYHHRIEIYLGSRPLGALRDLDVDDGPNEGACADEPFCRVNRNGQGEVNQPIKVIIEANAACFALDHDFDPLSEVCASATLAAGQTLPLQEGGQNIAAATPDQGATLALRACQDLRERGLVDLVTWGDCVEINSFDDNVTGVAELCNAPGEADGILSAEQIERLTIHRYSTTDGLVVALGHGEAENCSAPAPAQGQAYQFTKTELFARFAKRTWRSVTEQIRDVLTPQPVAACNRGCAGTDGFRSSYQVAGPGWWVPDPLDGDLGQHDPGTVVTAKANVFDSGEFEEDGSTPDPDAYANARVIVTLTQPGLAPQVDSVFSDADGLAEYSFTVVGGTNTVVFTAIGIGEEMGDLSTPIDNVYAPTMHSTDPNVTLGTGTLTFTAVGIIPFYFDPDPPTGDFKLGDDGLATFNDLKVCGTPGSEITSLEALKNNGEPTTFGGLPTLPVTIPTTPNEDGNYCYTFSGLTLDKTGAYRIVVNGEDSSQKINVKP
jgi:hypothetical protein